MNHYVGIDIGKNKLDVYAKGVYWETENNEEGLKELVTHLEGLKKSHVVVYEPKNIIGGRICFA